MTATTLLIAEDLWETPEVPGTQFELVNGELVEMPTAGRFTTRSWCCVSHSRRPHQFDDYRRFKAYKLRTVDWWQILSEAHDFIREEIRDRTLTPADELIHQLREERDAELVVLS